MAERTFELLKKREGMEASISGATQIRAGVLRPEVIIPDKNALGPASGNTTEAIAGLAAGTQVRVIRQPHFGQLGKVISLPSELVTLESGSKARVVEIEFPDGQLGLIPRANVELIER
jgi:hypothetical protein